MRPQRVGVTTAAMHYSFTRRSAPPYCSAGAAGWPMPHVATHDRARTQGADPKATPRRPRARTAGPAPRTAGPSPRVTLGTSQRTCGDPTMTGRDGPERAPKKDVRNMVLYVDTL